MRSTGEILKELRLERDLTQEQLGEILGVKKNTVSGWESKDYFPGKELLLKLSEFYNVTTDYLLGRTTHRRARVVKDGELLEFLPVDLVKNHDLEIWVDEKGGLEEATKEEIKKVLRQHGYLK